MYMFFEVPLAVAYTTDREKNKKKDELLRTTMTGKRIPITEMKFG